MTESKGRARQIVIYFIRTLLILALLGSIITGRELVMVISVVGLIVTFIPDVMKKFFDVRIPAEYELISLFFIYGALFLGEVRGLFAEFWWWDILLNLTASFTLGLVGITVLYALYKDKGMSSNAIIIAFLTFCFTFAMGTVWEVFEFTLDAYYGFSLQLSLRDTMTDLITNLIGSLIVSLAGYSYIKNGKIRVISTFVIDIIDQHPKLFSSKTTLEKASEEILALIKKGESSNLEFKSTLRTNLHTHDIDHRIEHSTLKTIVAFLNSQGGTLLIGVSDSGIIRGLETDHFQSNDALSLHFTNLLKEHIGNEFMPFINFELFPVEDKLLLKVQCNKSKKPVFLKIHKDEEFYIRNGPASVRLSAREAVEYINHNFVREK